MMNRHKISKSLLCGAALLALSACQTTQATQGEPTTSSKIDNVLSKAAYDANARGESGQSLMILEKIYKRNSEDPVAALRYAHALRENDYVTRASSVLAPFANDPNSIPGAKTEFAAIQLALGNYKSAEEYAQKAVVKDPDDFQAYHYLGIALDAQSMHKEAERAFRLGLDHWQGDPVTIMNNLALNLTSQGFLDEAIEILEKAKVLAPNRVEVERNLRIVRALQQTAHPAPKPVKKPSQ